MSRSRHLARQTALQVLYFWQVGGVTPQQAIGAYFREHEVELSEAARAFVETIVTGTAGEVGALDAIIEAHSTHWRLDRMAVIDRLILRMATWELRHAPDTPAAVVIDEAIELARTFGSDDSVRFVNGLLDAIRRTMEQERDVERG
jgi:N utilization substance protein B